MQGCEVVIQLPSSPDHEHALGNGFMPLFVVAHRSGAHRLAAIALYRALVSQSKKLDIPAERGDELHNLIKHRFSAFRHTTSHRELKLLFEAGYDAVDHLDAAVAGEVESKQYVLDLLRKAPYGAKKGNTVTRRFISEDYNEPFGETSKHIPASSDAVKDAAPVATDVARRIKDSTGVPPIRKTCTTLLIRKYVIPLDQYDQEIHSNPRETIRKITLLQDQNQLWRPTFEDATPEATDVAQQTKDTSVVPRIRKHVGPPPIKKMPLPQDQYELWRPASNDAKAEATDVARQNKDRSVVPPIRKITLLPMQEQWRPVLKDAGPPPNRTITEPHYDIECRFTPGEQWEPALNENIVDPQPGEHDIMYVPLVRPQISPSKVTPQWEPALNENIVDPQPGEHDTMYVPLVRPQISPSKVTPQWEPALNENIVDPQPGEDDTTYVPLLRPHISPSKVTPPRASIFERAIPREELGGTGKRQIPKIFSANQIPVLRFKKPQSPALTGYLNSRIEQRQKRHNLRQKLEAQFQVATLEDQWDAILEEHAALRKVRLEPRWDSEILIAIRRVNELLEHEKVKNRAMAEKMYGVIDRETKLAEEERRQEEELSRRELERRRREVAEGLEGLSDMVGDIIEAGDTEYRPPRI